MLLLIFISFCPHHFIVRGAINLYKRLHVCVCRIYVREYMHGVEVFFLYRIIKLEVKLFMQVLFRDKLYNGLRDR